MAQDEDREQNHVEGCQQFIDYMLLPAVEGFLEHHQIPEEIMARMLLEFCLRFMASMETLDPAEIARIAQELAAKANQEMGNTRREAQAEDPAEEPAEEPQTRRVLN